MPSGTCIKIEQVGLNSQSIGIWEWQGKMIALESIAPGLSLSGLELSVIGTVVAVVPIADGACQVLYKTPDGALKERLLNRGDETNISIATTERPWSFDGDGEAFKLTVEAKRIDLAFLFDPMMAVHTSNVEPLPHQITAVYESMLPRGAYLAGL
jgi:hypothetical protein